jgi:hypothetical protein
MHNERNKQSYPYSRSWSLIARKSIWDFLDLLNGAPNASIWLLHQLVIQNAKLI